MIVTGIVTEIETGHQRRHIGTKRGSLIAGENESGRGNMTIGIEIETAGVAISAEAEIPISQRFTSEV